MLRSIHFKNFVRYKEYQTLDFSSSGPFIFIGENGSGKSAVFEGIRRCLKLGYSTSVSTVPDSDNLSYFICNFETNPSENDVHTICGLVSTPATSQWMDGGEIAKQSSETQTRRLQTKKNACSAEESDQSGNRDNANKSNQSKGQANDMLYYKFVSEHSMNSPMFINLIETEDSADGSGLRVSKSYIINNTEFESERPNFIKTKPKSESTANDKNIQTYLQSIFKSIKDRPEETTENKLEPILDSLSKKIVFTFPLRSIGPLQWSVSNRIARECRTKNYEEAEKRCEIIKYFLTNKEEFDLEKEEKYFENLTQSNNYKFRLNDAGKIEISNNKFALLKTPEGILEAKAFSVLISSKIYKTLVLEDPDRGMHPQLVDRMVQIINEEKSNKQVILTTHQKGVITPWTVPATFVFKRCETESQIISCRSFFTGDNGNMKPMRMLSSHHVPDIFFARKALFYEGDSEDLFLREMKSQILAGKSSITSTLLRAHGETEAEANERVKRSLLQYTFIRMNGKDNLDFYESISNHLQLDRLFLVDRDHVPCILSKPNPEQSYGKSKKELKREIKKERKRQNKLAKRRLPKDWERIRQDLMDRRRIFFWLDGAIENMVKEICNDVVPGNKKLFISDPITSKEITRSVFRILNSCKPEHDLANFIKVF